MVELIKLAEAKLPVLTEIVGEFFEIVDCQLIEKEFQSNGVRACGRNDPTPTFEILGGLIWQQSLGQSSQGNLIQVPFNSMQLVARLNHWTC